MARCKVLIHTELAMSHGSNYEGGDRGGKCLWKKAGQPWKQGDTAQQGEFQKLILISLANLHKISFIMNSYHLVFSIPFSIFYLLWNVMV